ncbi:unnamed protein product, partial [Ectocarpus sp. 12 AP-2014]
MSANASCTLHKIKRRAVKISFNKRQQITDPLQQLPSILHSSSVTMCMYRCVWAGGRYPKGAVLGQRVLPQREEEKKVPYRQSERTTIKPQRNEQNRKKRARVKKKKRKTSLLRDILPHTALCNREHITSKNFCMLYVLDKTRRLSKIDRFLRATEGGG